MSEDKRQQVIASLALSLWVEGRELGMEHMPNPEALGRIVDTLIGAGLFDAIENAKESVKV